MRPVSAWFLAIVAVTTIVPGVLHAFLPDGGAGTIAGLDLSHRREVIVGVFAWAGATQIAWGGMLLLIALRVRSLVPAALTLVLLERSIVALNLWLLKPGAAAHRPPEAYATLVALPLIALALGLALTPTKESRP